MLRPALTAEEYRLFYNGVGGPWRWVDRNLMADDDLIAVIHDPRVEVHALQFGEQAAGYIELDGRQPGEVEIAYFGLFPEFFGRGVGSLFLAFGIRRAWRMLEPCATETDDRHAAMSQSSRAGQRRPRVWVHTCDWDHPAALGVYQKAGFELYDERCIEQRLPPSIAGD